MYGLKDKKLESGKGGGGEEARLEERMEERLDLGGKGGEEERLEERREECLDRDGRDGEDIMYQIPTLKTNK